MRDREAAPRGEEPCAVAVARRACALREETLPAEVAEAARLHLLDALGVGLAAASLISTRPLFAAVAGLGHGAQATVLGRREALPAASAALMNGTLIHGLEFDDTHMAAVVHASAVVAPVALATAEREGASGEALLKAFVLGWEALVRCGLASPVGFHARGFQGTSVLGAPVAALVAGWLTGADEDTLVQAMGIGGSQASGIFEFVASGARVKMLHGGWPAHAGVVAAALAAAGLTGPASVFEGERGLLRAFTDDARAPARLREQLEDLGVRWRLLEVAYKPYPCCHYLQAAVEAVLELRAAGLEPSQVARVDCALPPEVAWLVCEPREEKLAPASGHVAKFSLHYCLALALSRGGLDVADFDIDPPVEALRPLMQRVSYRPMPDSGFPARYSADLCVTLHDGTRRCCRIDDVKGTPARPFTAGDVRTKFRDNASRVLDATGVEAVIAEVAALGPGRDLKGLTEALRRVVVPPPAG